jgi:membrane-associated phospholipid phosphatase
MRRLILLLWICGLAGPAVLAEEAPDSREKEKPNFFSELLQDQKQIWSTPLQQKAWKSPKTYLFIGISAVSFSLDDEPARRLREDPSFKCFNDVFASTPADLTLAFFPVAVWAAGAISENAQVSDYGRKISRAALAGFTVSTVFKVATLRARPNSGKVYGFWEGGNSFPSGHSTVAWAIAASSVKHFSKHKWVPWVAFPTAGLIAFSRVSSGNHFPSDAVTGSLLGFAIGYYGVK